MFLLQDTGVWEFGNRCSRRCTMKFLPLADVHLRILRRGHFTHTRRCAKNTCSSRRHEAYALMQRDARVRGTHPSVFFGHRRASNSHVVVHQVRIGSTFRPHVVCIMPIFARWTQIEEDEEIKRKTSYNHLSYTMLKPLDTRSGELWWVPRFVWVVIRLGFEPKTPTLKVLCSTYWASESNLFAVCGCKDKQIFGCLQVFACFFSILTENSLETLP